MNRLHIIGAGGFGREVLAWALDIPQADWYVEGFLDANPQALESFSCPYNILGNPETFSPSESDLFVCAVGDPIIRLRLCRKLKERGATFLTLIHPTALVGPRCKIGEGCILCPGAVLTTDISIGNYVTLNAYATVGHDVIMKDGCTLSGHSDVTGAARLGEGVFVGSHAAVLPRVTVGDYAVIGAGSIALRNVKPYSTVMGIPAKVIYTASPPQNRLKDE